MGGTGNKGGSNGAAGGVTDSGGAGVKGGGRGGSNGADSEVVSEAVKGQGIWGRQCGGIWGEAGSLTLATWSKGRRACSGGEDRGCS